MAHAMRQVVGLGGVCMYVRVGGEGRYEGRRRGSGGGGGGGVLQEVVTRPEVDSGLDRRGSVV
jgi:hypothetical protein